MTSDSMELLRTKNGGRFGRAMRKEFLFDDKWVNLNHGSFGTYPRAIRDVLRTLQDASECRPDAFIRYQYPKLLDEARQSMSKYLNVPTNELVFVPNATTGFNTILQNFDFQPYDYILYSATIYGGCEKAVARITETTPAKAARIEYTFPVEDAWLVSAFAAKIKEIEAKGGKVKVAVFDTVVSIPGVRLPFEKLVDVCREAGVMSLVDGAHGVGHVELDLAALGADFFVSNCHKWLHTPRGCAILHVPLRHQHLIRTTLPTSHGYINKPVPPFDAIGTPFPASDSTKSAFEENFVFTGTINSSPYICVPAAIKWREDIGGEDVIREYCWALAKEGAKLIAGMLGTEIMDNATGTLTRCCMVNVALPLDASKMQEIGAKAGIEKAGVGNVVRDWMSSTWMDDYDTYIQSMFYKGRWWIRMSSQVYLEMADFEWAGKIVKEVCERGERGEWAEKKSKL